MKFIDGAGFRPWRRSQDCLDNYLQANTDYSMEGHSFTSGYEIERHCVLGASGAVNRAFRSLYAYTTASSGAEMSTPQKGIRKPRTIGVSNDAQMGTRAVRFIM